ncbi:hypothetical protein [Sediminicola luteus]|uniref:DUF2975 domain-containing protein n=1 Tax=Sediminicola luteus TaxID=319238 RepID=A0A2A4G1F5_9FLAO|nr:hypothetical protein [Sediminicola luteus]PCE62809.1 hypothetical protein B7P33_16130 [Sediminicola luteus]
MKNLTTILYIIIWLYIVSGLIKIYKTIKVLLDTFSGIAVFDITEIAFHLFKIGLAIYLIYHFFLFSRTVNKFDEKSFFNLKNGLRFKSTGKAIVVFALLNFSASILYAVNVGSDLALKNLPEQVIPNFFLLMMALFLLIQSKVILSGNQQLKKHEPINE